MPQRTGKPRSSRLFGRLLALSIAIVMTLCMMIWVGGALFSDIVQYQTAQFMLRSADMLKQSVTQLHEQTRELLDQMILSMPLGSLMNYAQADAVDLLSGLRQLDAFRKGSAHADAIYLYNAQNDSFYITGDHSLQAVQKRGEMFDAGMADMVTHIQDYANALPVVREVAVSYPAAERLRYVTFVRYNTLSKGRTNVYAVNIPADAFFRHTEVWPRTGRDALMLLNPQGGVVCMKEAVTDADTLAALVTAQTRERGTLMPERGVMVCYDKTFPFGWTFVYRVALDEVSTVLSSGGGMARIVLLAALCAVLFVLLILFFRRWMGSLRARAAEVRQLQQERDGMRLVAQRHAVLQALKGEADAAADEYRGCITRLLLAVPAASAKDLTADVRRALAQMNADVLFLLDDDARRVVACLRDTDDENALLSLQENVPENALAFAALSDAFAYPDDLADAYRWCVDMTAYQPLCAFACVLTSKDALTRAQSAEYPQAEASHLITAIQALDASEASSALDAVVRLLARGTPRSYQAGLMRLTLAVTEALTQLYKLYGVQGDVPPLWPEDIAPNAVTATLSRAVQSAVCDAQDRRGARYDDLMRGVTAYIDAHCGDTAFSCDDVARAFELSPSYIARLYKKQTGASVSEYITKSRLERAKRALADSAESVASIAAECGFADAQYFYKVFKKTVGMTPGDYRRARADEQAKENEHDADE